MNHFFAPGPIYFLILTEGPKVHLLDMVGHAKERRLRQCVCASIMAAGMLWLVPATVLVSSLLVSTSIRVLELARARLHHPASVPCRGSPLIRR